MISERQVDMNALLIGNAHKLPGLEDDHAMLIFQEQNKTRLVVVHSRYDLTIITILTIRVASNFKTDMKSPRIVYGIKILEIE